MDRTLSLSVSETTVCLIAHTLITVLISSLISEGISMVTLNMLNIKAPDRKYRTHQLTPISDANYFTLIRTVKSVFKRHDL